MKYSHCPSCGATLSREEGIPSRIGLLCPGCATLYSAYETRLFGRELAASVPLFVLPNALYWISVLAPDGFLYLGWKFRMAGLAAALTLAGLSGVLVATGLFPLFGSEAFLQGFWESQTDSSGRSHPLLWTARLPSEAKRPFRTSLLCFLTIFFLVPVSGTLLSILTLVRGIKSLLHRRANPREILSSGQKCYPESFFRTFPHPMVGTFLDPDCHPTLRLKVGDRDGEWINEGHVVFHENLYGVLRIPGSEEMVFLSLDSAKGELVPAGSDTTENIRRMIAP